MSVIVSVPHLSTESAVELYAVEHGHTWRAGIFDRKSKELIGQLKHAGPTFENEHDAIVDAERIVLEKMREIQVERDTLPQQARNDHLDGHISSNPGRRDSY